MNTLAAKHQTTAQDARPSALDAETIVRALDEETVRALGLLDKAPRGIPELAIASFDYGSRATLEAYELFTSKHRHDDTLQVGITPLGREVIKLCASDMPTLATSDLAAAVENAKELLALATDSTVRAVPA
jgi:hypothetical protein